MFIQNNAILSRPSILQTRSAQKQTVAAQHEPVQPDEIRFSGKHKRTQSELNALLNENFSQAFEQGQLEKLFAFADEQMPSLFPASHPVSARLKQDGYHLGTEELPALGQIKAGKTRLSVSREFGIRVYHDGRQITTDMKNIPRHYPWFKPDARDPDNLADYAAKHVGRGSRGESPWHESKWPLVGGVQQGKQNWPHRDAAFGPYELKQVAQGRRKAIKLSLPKGADGATKPNAYGVVPKGLFAVNEDGSITMALQHDNKSDKGLDWSPWFVLGFAMPKEGTMHDPSAVFAWPDPHAKDPETPRMDKVWNYSNIGGQKVVLVNPHAKTLNEPFKKFYRDTNWSMVALKDSDHVVLTRSMLRHKEQYFPFLEHGQYFVEAEHTGAPVPPGKTGTVIVKHDFLPVAGLTGGKITKLGESGDFETDVRTVLDALVKLDNEGKLTPNYRK